MSKQNEALRLADRLEKRRLTRWVHATGETPRASGYVVDQDCAEAAAELRRLHAVNQELLEALLLMVATHDEPAGFVGKYGRALDEAINKQQQKIDARLLKARVAIAKAEEKNHDQP
jgi:hypothetical protein